MWGHAYRAAALAAAAILLTLVGLEADVAAEFSEGWSWN
jgi:hypothetical protein